MNKYTRLLRYDLPLHFVLLFTNWLPDNVIFLRLRGAMAAPFFYKCGENLRLGRNLSFYNPSMIDIGKDVYIAYGCWFMAGEKIVIGDEVMFGPYCVTVSSEHQKSNNLSYRFANTKTAPIKIGAGTWIAANVTITSGCEIGQGCLIGAAAVVTTNIPDNVIAVGVPAKEVGM